MKVKEETSTQVKEYFFVAAQRQKQELIAQGRQIADLSIGNPDLPPPAEVVSAFHSNVSLPGAHGYQSNAGNAAFLHSAISWYQRFFDVKLQGQSQVLPLQGSRQGILQLSQLLLSSGDQVLVPDPGYPSYAFGARMMGASTLPYSLRADEHFLPDLQKIEQQDLSRVKIMWVNYPHMPTGAGGTCETFESLVAFAHKHKILLVNDNAYALVRNNNPLSILAVPGADEVALELNSLSKNYHLAGWRLGFLAGNADVIARLARLKSHLDSGIALPLQLAAARALDLGYQWFAPMSNQYRQRAQWALQLAHAMGCVPAGGELGMFLWVKMPETGMSAEEFANALLHKAGVLVAPGSLFGSQGEGHLRISLCAPQETFILAMENILNSPLFNSKLN